MLKRAIVSLLLVFSLLLSLCACSAGNKPLSKTDFVLNTVAIITLYPGELSAAEANELLSDTFSLCREYERLLSRTISGSDVWRINHSESQPVTVDSRTFELIERALYYCSLSEGAFDITIAPVSELWDFSSESPKTPDSKELSQALELVGWERLKLDRGTLTVTLEGEGGIDLGGVAKGYIADRAADLIKQSGASGATINLGGNIVTVGGKPDGTKWNIGIQKPFGESSESLGTLTLGECSVVTSGIYERCFYENDVLYHHLLDTSSGMPVNNELCAVTVITERSLDGDALSTVLYLLGEQRGRELVEELDNVSAVFVRSDGTVGTAGSAELKIN